MNRNELQSILEAGGIVKPPVSSLNGFFPDKLPSGAWADIAYPSDPKAQARVITLLENAVDDGMLPSSDTAHTEFLVLLYEYNGMMAIRACNTSVLSQCDVKEILFIHGELPSESARIHEWRNGFRYGKLSKQQIREKVLCDWVGHGVRKAAKEGRRFDRMNIAMGHTEMWAALNKFNKLEFPPMSTHTFDKFWQKQKYCTLKGGRPKKTSVDF